MSDIEPIVTVREAYQLETIKPAQFVYRTHFMGMEHNYLCACCRYHSAVIDCSTGVLQPCWDCQAKGYYLEKKSWLRKILRL